jgi:hypothetical protein
VVVQTKTLPRWRAFNLFFILAFQKQAFDSVDKKNLVA